MANNSDRGYLNGHVNGDWIIRLVLGAILMWALTEISRMRVELSDARAQILRSEATIESLRRDITRLEMQAREKQGGTR